MKKTSILIPAIALGFALHTNISSAQTAGGTTTGTSSGGTTGETTSGSSTGNYHGNTKMHRKLNAGKTTEGAKDLEPGRQTKAKRAKKQQERKNDDVNKSGTTSTSAGSTTQ